MGISKPPLSKVQIEDMLKRQQIERDAHKLKFQAEMARAEQMTEIKRRKIQEMLDAKTMPTSSQDRYNPYKYNPAYDTKTPIGHKPEDWITSGTTETTYTTPEPEQHTPHVVPTSGKKHHNEVEDISHTIVPARKSIIEIVSCFFSKKTRSIGPK